MSESLPFGDYPTTEAIPFEPIGRFYLADGTIVRMVSLDGGVHLLVRKESMGKTVHVLK